MSIDLTCDSGIVVLDSGRCALATAFTACHQTPKDVIACLRGPGRAVLSRGFCPRAPKAVYAGIRACVGIDCALSVTDRGRVGGVEAATREGLSISKYAGS